jgi:hypothetical protein
MGFGELAGLNPNSLRNMHDWSLRLHMYLKLHHNNKFECRSCKIDQRSNLLWSNPKENCSKGNVYSNHKEHHSNSQTIRLRVYIQ